MENLQDDLFLAPRFNTLEALMGPNGKPSTILIGCGHTKRKTAAPARLIYTSDRFQTACESAETLGAKYFILSGLHGLVEPEQILEPYDLDLDTLDTDKKSEWNAKVMAALRQVNDPGKLCILSAAAYSDPIVQSIASCKDMPPVSAPLAKIDERYHEAWHQQAFAASKRVSDLRRLYDLIDSARIRGKTFLLGKLSKQELPARGVYVFLDSREPNFDGTSPRIVRIGTHAISEGSKSTLRTRLRNHLGSANGSGSHRGSIFRLHVGRAMLDKENALDQLQSWGSGQDAPAQIRAEEQEHEARVSDYLRRLEVFIVEIEDKPSKHSLRASVERQLIALCSEALQPIDTPTDNWLGLQSPMELIVSSGLWNIRDVGREYDPSGTGSVQEICSWGA